MDMPVPPTETTRRNQQTARILLGVALTVLGLYTLQGFLHALAWAAILAIATWPLYRRARLRFGVRGHDVLLPLLFTVVAVLMVMVPLTLLVVEAGREARIALPWITEARTQGVAPPDWLAQLPAGASQATAWWDANLARPEDAQRLLGRIDRAQLFDFSRSIGPRLIHQGVTLVFTLLTLFFLFRDGPQLADKLLESCRRMFGAGGERVARQMVASVHGTVDGLVLVGLGEGAILGVGYAIAGVPHAALLGGATAIAAVIPMGAPVVLALASIIALAQSHTVAAAVLFGVGMMIIFVADHAVRPALIGGATRLPFLWVLLGILGGVETFGLLGLFLGPAIMAALILLWREWTGDAKQDAPT